MKGLKKSVLKGVFKWTVVVSLCLLLGVLLGELKRHMLQDSLVSVQQELQAFRFDNNMLSKRVVETQASLMTDKETIKLLRQDNKKLNNQLVVLSNKLYFYERVVAPELHRVGAQIYSFSVQQKGEKNQWEYELVLMQSQKGRRLLTGKWALNFSVVNGEQRHNISIKELSESVIPTFKFKYFQTIKGSFTLPAEMLVDDVILALDIAGNRWYKAQQIEKRYAWKALIENKD